MPSLGAEPCNLLGEANSNVRRRIQPEQRKQRPTVSETEGHSL
jgi:hypothetical protein